MNKYFRLTVVAGLVAAVAVIAAMKNRQIQPPAATAPQTSEQMNPAATGLPRLVDLGAGACIPCKMMAPILEELTTRFKGRFDVVFIDVRQNPDEAKKHRISIIPTQIFYDPAGKELFRHEGFFSRDDILNTWKQLGYDFTAELAPAGTEN